MTTWITMSVVMIAMLVLSGFFSASEAALFSLTTQQKNRLQKNRLSDRLIENLISNANRLLSCILLCNLAVNTTFFACANIIASDLVPSDNRETFEILIGLVAVAVLIVLGELFPKSFGVLAPLKISRLIAIPLSCVMWFFGPIAMTMSFINDIVRRLLWPGLVAESSMEISDLERAIELSETDSRLIDLEKGILQNVIQLSTIEAQEWMRPQSEFDVIHLPVSRERIQSCLDDVSIDPVNPVDRQRVLVLAGASNDVVAVTTVAAMQQSLRDRTELHLEPLECVPWCATLANSLHQMVQLNRQSALVVNERGQSIGIIQHEDLIQAVFSVESSKTQGFSRPHFAKTGQAQWEVTGITRIRQLERSLETKLPECRDATIAGLLQSQLRRLAQVGDRVEWGPLVLEVVELPRRGEMLVRITSTEIDVPQEWGQSDE